MSILPAAGPSSADRHPQNSLQFLIPILSPHSTQGHRRQLTNCPWEPPGELSDHCLFSPPLSPKGIIYSPHFSCLLIHNPRNVTSKHHHHTDTHLSFLTDLSSLILLFNSCPLTSRKFLSPVFLPPPCSFQLCTQRANQSRYVLKDSMTQHKAVPLGM